MKPRFPKNDFTDNWRAKNASAQALGRLGGLARAKSLSKERLSEIGKAAITKRWSKNK